jgi:hypothetical protein
MPVTYKVEQTGGAAVSIARAIGVTLLSLSIARPALPALEHIAPGGTADVFPGTYVPQLRTPTVLLHSVGASLGQNLATGVASHVVAGVGASVGVNYADGRAPSQSVGSSLGSNIAIGAGSPPEPVGSSLGENLALGVGRERHGAVGSSTGTNTAVGVGQNGPWPAHVVLRPTIDDDGWGGTLAYAWTQVDGPASATIVSAAAASTEVIVTEEIAGTYLFRLTVSRADDALVSAITYRVYAFSAFVAPVDATGAVTLTINGIEQREHAESVRITKQPHGADRCTFAIAGGRIEEALAAPIAVFNEVILERYNVTTNATVRLFGGVCLTLEKTVEDDQNLVCHPSCVGYAWHLGRVRVTKTYTGWSISVIAADLLALAPGGITGDFIASGLRAVTIRFDDVTIAEAFTQLTRQDPDLKWDVDAFKRLYLGPFKTGDPVGLSPDHQTFKDLSITTDGSLTANRVTVYYTDPVRAAGGNQPTGSIIGEVALDATEIQVSSLEGYGAGGSFTLDGGGGIAVGAPGGIVVVDGHVFSYAGTARRMARSVYGNVSCGYTSALPVETSDGELGETAFELANPGAVPAPTGTYKALFNPPILYWISLSTSRGETPPIQKFAPGFSYFLDGDVWEIDRTHVLITQGGSSNVHPIEVHQNAVEVWVLGVSGDDDVRSQVTGINIYRESTEASHAGDAPGTIFLVASLPPRGGSFVDKVGKARLAPIQEPAAFTYDDTFGHRSFDEPWSYFLTGVTLESSTGTAATSARTFVVVDDLASQADLAAQFGGGDPGIIAVSIDGGTISAADAVTLGRAYLDGGIKAIQTSLSCALRDDAAGSGQVLSVNFPAPLNCVDDLTIQQVTIAGFEGQYPHERRIVAGAEIVTLEDLLRRKALAASGVT